MKSRRAYRKKKQLIGMCLVFILVFGFCALCFGGVAASAKPEKKQAYYTSVTVETGDSLWSLAQKYAPEYSDLQEYVELLKSLNHLRQGDLILAGQKLIVVYYQ